MKGLMAFLLLSASCATGLRNQTPPSGTVLPVRLSATLSSTKGKPEQIVTARVMQNVRLKSGDEIRKGTQIVGHISKFVPASGSAAAEIMLTFDTLKPFKPHGIGENQPQSGSLESGNTACRNAEVLR